MLDTAYAYPTAVPPWLNPTISRLPANFTKALAEGEEADRYLAARYGHGRPSFIRPLGDLELEAFRVREGVNPMPGLRRPKLRAIVIVYRDGTHILRSRYGDGANILQHDAYRDGANFLQRDVYSVRPVLWTEAATRLACGAPMCGGAFDCEKKWTSVASDEIAGGGAL